MVNMDETWDVVVMGGGLAGLSLSIQLKRANPELRVLVAERLPHPPPDAAFKVGESTIDGAGHYFRNVLQIHDYLVAEHLIKAGLRFYFSHDGNKDITERVELGDEGIPTWVAYQVDRGRLEAKLSDLAQELGVAFLDRCRVTEVEMGEPTHTVTFIQDDAEQQVTARWVIDATGRRSMLKRRLKLEEDAPHHTANAVWFRVESKVDMGTWAADDREWQERVEKPEYRWRSTNHLMGDGYWVWIIPLGEKYTSIGIVADERHQPLDQFDSFDKALEWLQANEPQVFDAVDAVKDTQRDFKVLKSFSFGCKQMYSADRWAVLGNAGLFHDPLYSPGSDVIAANNTFVASLIERDLAGEDISSRADRYNDLFINGFAGPLWEIYTDKYALMGNSQVFSVKIMWDYYWYWAVLCPIYFQGKLTDLDFIDSVEHYVERSNQLNSVAQRFFMEWHELDPSSSVSGHYVNIAEYDSLTRMHDELGEEFTEDQLRENFAYNVKVLEDILVECFWRAVKVLPNPPERCKINAYAISLDPERWEADGLFTGEAATEPNRELAAELDSMWFDPTYREPAYL